MKRERRKEDGQGQARMPSSSWIGLDCFPRSKANGACAYIQFVCIYLMVPMYEDGLGMGSGDE
jgi:hypothetical protein